MQYEINQQLSNPTQTITILDIYDANTSNAKYRVQTPYGITTITEKQLSSFKSGNNFYPIRGEDWEDLLKNNPDSDLPVLI